MNPGIDIVAVERFRHIVQRMPSFLARFFTPEELAYCNRAADPVVRLAGTFAAKGAVMKAVGLTPAPAWAKRIEITRAASGVPKATVEGREVAVSISHDGGLAIAVAVPIADGDDEESSHGPSGAKTRDRARAVALREVAPRLGAPHGPI